MDIMTLTGNLLAEWTFSIEQLRLGTTHRANTMSFQAGGKGINVSRVLQRLGTSTEALAFADGPLASACEEWLNAHEVPHQFFPLGGSVRPGLVVKLDSGARTETTFLGEDPPVPESSWIAAVGKVAEQRPLLLAICGSIPGWQASWLDPVRDLLQSGRIRVCVDSYGPPLADLINLPLDLVKINRTELERLFEDAPDESSLDLLARISSTSPVRNWIITDGGNPILAAFEDGALMEVHPAAIDEVSPTGSGDTFLAVFIHNWIAGNQPVDALSEASACASANAARSDVGNFALPVPDLFRPEIHRL